MNIADEAVEAAGRILDAEFCGTLATRDLTKRVLTAALPYIMEGLAREAETAGWTPEYGLMFSDHGSHFAGYLRSLASMEKT